MLILRSVRCSSCKRFDGDSFSLPIYFGQTVATEGDRSGLVNALSACPVRPASPANLLSEVS
jgi:hypothetical protein